MDKGISLQVILKDLSFRIMGIHLPNQFKMFLMKRMAEIE